MNKYILNAYVYCHVQDLQDVEALKEKAINFCSSRNINIIDYCSCNVISLIHLLLSIKVDALLINNHDLTVQEHRLLIAFCHRNNIAIIHYEK